VLSRAPIPPLRPFVRLLWATGEGGGAIGATVARERVLPTGAVHVVFRTEPLRIFDGEDDLAGRLVGCVGADGVDTARVRTLGGALVGGPRATYYVRDAAPAGSGVGALLHPGAAPLLLGVPADELAGRHVDLDGLWGAAAVAEARERVLAPASPEARLAAFEAVLRARLPVVRGVHPAIAAALDQLREHADIGGAVERSGYSHRRFLTLFREAVGLTPRDYCRVQRFQRAVAMATRAASLASVAYDAGYADQPHLTREFRAIAGVSPGEYRALAPSSPNHVPFQR
jgi:AraC-like DNA-binding protein